VTGSRVREFRFSYRSREEAVATAGWLSPSETPHIRIALRLTLDETIAGVGRSRPSAATMGAKVRSPL
jgi:hypothetical protein